MATRYPARLVPTAQGYARLTGHLQGDRNGVDRAHLNAEIAHGALVPARSREDIVAVNSRVQFLQSLLAFQDALHLKDRVRAYLNALLAQERNRAPGLINGDAGELPRDVLAHYHTPARAGRLFLSTSVIAFRGHPVWQRPQPKHLN